MQRSGTEAIKTKIKRYKERKARDKELSSESLQTEFWNRQFRTEIRHEHNIQDLRISFSILSDEQSNVPGNMFDMRFSAKYSYVCAQT